VVRQEHPGADAGGTHAWDDVDAPTGFASPHVVAAAQAVGMSPAAVPPDTYPPAGASAATLSPCPSHQLRLDEIATAVGVGGDESARVELVGAQLKATM
jgi:hypothetical protein